LPQQSLHGDGVRTRQRSNFRSLSHAFRAESSDTLTSTTDSIKDVVNNPISGRFAVCSRDADCAQFVCGIPVHHSGKLAKRETRILHNDAR
jgi:hypothetical protein